MALGAAGQGHAPVTDRSQVRNRVPIKQWTEVPNQPYLPGRERQLPGAQQLWCEQTKRWWDAVRTMPHCVLWAESDWEFAYTTALLHQSVWAMDDHRKAAELRNRERYMGCTAEARDGLRIRYIEPGNEPTESTHRAPVVHAGFGQPRPRPRAVDPSGSAQ